MGVIDQRKAPLMLHLLPKSHAIPDSFAPVVEATDCAASAERPAAAPVVITEQEVLFSTAAAVSVPAAVVSHRHWPGAAFFSAVGHIRLRLPEARPHCPRCEGSYFEAARMSRAMEHL
jgi:hypothetical protein